MMTTTLLLTLLLALLLVLVHGPLTVTAEQFDEEDDVEEIVAVDFLVTTQYTNSTNEAQQFIARIYDPATIAIARSEIQKETPPYMIIAGTIIKEMADWNPDWSFYIDPDTVIFGDLFTEVCDANVEFVEENLEDAGGAFLPNNFWCPWSSRVLEEVGNETVILEEDDDVIDTFMPGEDGNETAVPSSMITTTAAPSTSPPIVEFTLPPVTPAPVVATTPTEAPTLPPSSATSWSSMSRVVLQATAFGSTLLIAFILEW